MSESPATWALLLTTPLWLGAAFGLEALLRAADRLSRASRHGRGWGW